MTEAYSHIRTSIERHVAWIEFNRPPINAFNRVMLDETCRAVEVAIGHHEVRVLVLASALDKYFSAGADLNVFKGLSPDGVRDWAVRCHEVARLAAVGGDPNTAVGGGLEMTLHCDLRAAA